VKRLTTSISIAIIALALTVSIASAAKPVFVTICHGAGLAGTTQYVTLTLPEQAVYGQAGHFNEDGTPQAGHEEDHLGPCVTETPTPTVEPTVEPTLAQPTASPEPSATPGPMVTPAPTLGPPIVDVLPDTAIAPEGGVPFLAIAAGVLLAVGIYMAADSLSKRR